MTINTIGIIGGSGLDDPKILKNPSEKDINTPYGKPSDKLIVGKINNTKVVILSRHSKHHNIPPHKLPFLANIYALKLAGCQAILATTACGSLKQEYKPGDFIFTNQFIDWTKQRPSTFFDKKVIHTPMADPFDNNLRKKLIKTAKQLKIKYHPQGTVITIEGPRFSSRAESNLFRSFNADIINMSTVPEVTLANELGIPYQTIAMVTDYDCWKKNEESVTYELILKRMEKNSGNAIRLLTNVIKDL